MTDEGSPSTISDKRSPLREVGALVRGALLIAVLVVVAGIGLNIAVLLPPRSACGRPATLLVRLVASVEEVAPLLLGACAFGALAVGARRNQYRLVGWLYSIAFLLSVAILVAWVIFVASSSTTGEQVFCDIVP